MQFYQGQQLFKDGKPYTISKMTGSMISLSYESEGKSYVFNYDKQTLESMVRIGTFTRGGALNNIINRIKKALEQ